MMLFVVLSDLLALIVAGFEGWLIYMTAWHTPALHTYPWWVVVVISCGIYWLLDHLRDNVVVLWQRRHKYKAVR